MQGEMSGTYHGKREKGQGCTMQEEMSVTRAVKRNTIFFRAPFKI